jgi:hypothetical protein
MCRIHKQACQPCASQCQDTVSVTRRSDVPARFNTHPNRTRGLSLYICDTCSYCNLQIIQSTRTIHTNAHTVSKRKSIRNLSTASAIVWTLRFLSRRMHACMPSLFPFPHVPKILHLFLHRHLSSPHHLLWSEASSSPRGRRTMHAASSRFPLSGPTSRPVPTLGSRVDALAPRCLVRWRDASEPANTSLVSPYP